MERQRPPKPREAYPGQFRERAFRECKPLEHPVQSITVALLGIGAVIIGQRWQPLGISSDISQVAVTALLFLALFVVAYVINRLRAPGLIEAERCAQLDSERRQANGLVASIQGCPPSATLVERITFLKGYVDKAHANVNAVHAAHAGELSKLRGEINRLPSLVVERAPERDRSRGLSVYNAGGTATIRAEARIVQNGGFQRLTENTNVYLRWEKQEESRVLGKGETALLYFADLTLDHPIASWELSAYSGSDHLVARSTAWLVDQDKQQVVRPRLVLDVRLISDPPEAGPPKDYRVTIDAYVFAVERITLSGPHTAGSRQSESS